MIDSQGNEGDGVAVKVTDYTGSLPYFILSLVLIAAPRVHSQNGPLELWSVRYDGPSHGVDLLSDVAVDNEHNIYATGRSSGSGTGQDYATIKYSPEGKELLVMRYHRAETVWDEATDLLVNDVGDIYVTGNSATIKYSTDGDIIWETIHSNLSASEFHSEALALDNSGNVYAAGNSWTSGFGSDLTVTKLSPMGEELWTAYFPADSIRQHMFVSMEVDGFGNVYLAASTDDEFLGDYWVRDIITVKFDGDGEEEWSRTFGGPSPSDDNPTALRIDRNGNVIVTGSTNSGAGKI